MARRKRRRADPAQHPPTPNDVAEATAPPAPLVSVVVVTYNSRRHLPDLLQSLRAQTISDLELLHIDSGSVDATCAVMAHHWPAIRQLRSPDNLGYRRGNQRGMDQANGRYVLIVNDDVELHPRLLEELVAAAEGDPSAAIIAPAILQYGSSSMVNAAGSALLPAGFYAARGKNQPFAHFHRPAEIAAASGCCFLVRRSFLDTNGGFSAVFDTLPSGWHASCEDLDLCWRAWACGWRVLYQPRAILWHKYAQKALDTSRFASLVGGRLVFLTLNYSTPLLLRLAPVLLATEFALLLWSASRGLRYLRVWATCWYWTWRNRRRLLELRSLRLARQRAQDSTLLARMQPSLPLAPDLRRAWPVRVAANGWFALNALALGPHAVTHAMKPLYPAAKRTLDFLFALSLLASLFPLLLVLAALVRWRLGSPILFRQTRIGRHDRPFTLLKFRSMRDARSDSGDPLPDAQRLTPFGQWLRSWSLDELPQLWNILCGEMSFIGPRPLLPEYLPRYSPEHRARHEVLPGLSGLAQVSGRNATTWQRRLDLDVHYVRNVSLRLDLSIAWRTLGRLFRRHGIAQPGSTTMPEFWGLGQDA